MKKDKKSDFILVSRSIINQAWYRDQYASVVYLHLRLVGEELCDIQVMAGEMGLTSEQVKTALKRLETEDMITVVPCRQGLLIAVHEVR